MGGEGEEDFFGVNCRWAVTPAKAPASHLGSPEAGSAPEGGPACWGGGACQHGTWEPQTRVPGGEGGRQEPAHPVDTHPRGTLASY